jgi:hypothetical protein
MVMWLNRFYSSLKQVAFWGFFLSFLSVAVMNQQPFVKDLTSNSPTAEILLEANALTFFKKWYSIPSFLIELDEDSHSQIHRITKQIFSPTQDLNTPSNPYVYEHFNIPPPKSMT